jgi:hypothetical protein
LKVSTQATAHSEIEAYTNTIQERYKTAFFMSDAVIAASASDAAGKVRPKTQVMTDTQEVNKTDLQPHKGHNQRMNFVTRSFEDIACPYFECTANILSDERCGADRLGTD